MSDVTSGSDSLGGLKSLGYPMIELSVALSRKLAHGSCLFNKVNIARWLKIKLKCRVHAADHVFREDCQVLNDVSETAEHVVNRIVVSGAMIFLS